MSKIIENIVININDKLVLNERLDDEKTLGISKKTENGFKIPPEKNNIRLNWSMSKNKKIKEALFERIFFL